MNLREIPFGALTELLSICIAFNTWHACIDYLCLRYFDSAGYILVNK